MQPSIKNKHKIILVAGICLIFLALLAWLIFRSINSGYWELRSDDSHFKVPSDWQKVSFTSSYGEFGVFWCLDLTGAGKRTDFKCKPATLTIYKLQSEPQHPDELFNQIATDNSFSLETGSVACNF